MLFGCVTEIKIKQLELLQLYMKLLMAYFCQNWNNSSWSPSCFYKLKIEYFVSSRGSYQLLILKLIAVIASVSLIFYLYEKKKCHTALGHYHK